MADERWRNTYKSTLQHLETDLRAGYGEKVLNQMREDILKRNLEGDFVWSRAQTMFDMRNPFLRRLPPITGISITTLIRRLHFVGNLHDSKSTDWFNEFILEWKTKLLHDDKQKYPLINLLEDFRMLLSKKDLHVSEKVIEMVNEPTVYLALFEGLTREVHVYNTLLEETCITICLLYYNYGDGLSQKLTKYLGKVLLRELHHFFRPVEHYIQHRYSANQKFLETQYIVSKRTSDYFSYPKYRSKGSTAHHFATSLIYYTIGFVAFHTSSTKVVSYIALATKRHPLPTSFVLLQLLKSLLLTGKFHFQKDELHKIQQILMSTSKHDILPCNQPLNLRCCMLLKTMDVKPSLRVAIHPKLDDSKLSICGDFSQRMRELSATKATPLRFSDLSISFSSDKSSFSDDDSDNDSAISSDD